MRRDAEVAGATRLTRTDLEMAARYAERRARDLLTEAATANSHYAKQSITCDARDHERRARKYRRAATNAPDTITSEDARAALAVLEDYLLATTSPTEARDLNRDLNRLHRKLARHDAAKAA